jgi:hypothetical protein
MTTDDEGTNGKTQRGNAPGPGPIPKSNTKYYVAGVFVVVFVLAAIFR